MIHCAICQREFRRITATHLAKHSLTVIEYQQRFPGRPLSDPALQETYAAILRKEARSTKGRERRRKIATRLWTRPGHRKKIAKLTSARWGAGGDLRTANELMKADPAYQKAISRLRQALWNDPEYQLRVSQGLQEVWDDPDYKASVSAERSSRFEDPEYRQRAIENLKPNQLSNVLRWTKPEKKLRDILIEMHLFGPEAGTIKFKDHVYVPDSATRMFNGDFVDLEHRLIIHVDGWHHRHVAKTMAWDLMVNAWCASKDWVYLRIPDTEIYEDPEKCRREIGLLITQSRRSWLPSRR